MSDQVGVVLVPWLGLAKQAVHWLIFLLIAGLVLPGGEVLPCLVLPALP